MAVVAPGDLFADAARKKDAFHDVTDIDVLGRHPPDRGDDFHREPGSDAVHESELRPTVAEDTGSNRSAGNA
jgi:hypothetical protein